ncbi:MAG: hypothetical protein ACOYXB_12780 [Bacteroidota bacterium]
MEEDKIYSALIRETAMHKAPDGFTAAVMDRVKEKTAPTAYKPLIGPAGQLMIGAFVILLTVLGIVLGEKSDEPGMLEKWFSGSNLSLPAVDFSLALPVLAILAAIFILMLFDARYQRRKLSW